LARLRDDYRCHEIPDDRSLVVTTGRYFADGQAVEVVVRPTADGESLVVGDAGLVAARLELEDIDAFKGRPRELWQVISDSFGVREVDGRIYARGDLEHAADLITRVADAVLSLDVVRHSVTATPAERFDRQVRRWLIEDLGMPVLEERTVPSQFGDGLTVAAVVQAPRRRVAVMAASGTTTTARRQSAEHAYFVFSQIAESWDISQRLTVLDGASELWRPELLRVLRQTSYVGSWSRQLTLARFLRGDQLPEDNDLMPAPEPPLPLDE
jgi:hypothetical protein